MTVRVLAIVQAGGAGGRMDVLTREVPKPVLPFAGNHRLIDVPLSNLRNSGISEVWVSVQFLSQFVADAVGNGKAWDLDRHRGGLKVIMPQQGAGSPADEGFVSGNAEELLQNRDAIRRHRPDAVVVLSADHVYRVDYAEVVSEHLRRGAECTVVTTEVGLDDARHHATIETDETGRVLGLEYKPSEPRSGVVATEVFVYSPAPLIEVLEAQHRSLSRFGEDDPDGSLLGDFGEHLLPALVERGLVWAYPLEGYWQDLGRPETYFSAHQDLLDSSADLFDEDWPLITNGVDRLPARLHRGSVVEDSLLSHGCVISGTVRRSVLGPGVRVEPGAVVDHCVIFDHVVVERGAHVRWAVVADESVIGAGAAVGADYLGADNPGADTDPEHLVLVGRQSSVSPGVAVEPGARLEPGTRA